MSITSRLKNRLIAKLITHYPSLAKGFIKAYVPWESQEVIPWEPPTKPLKECKLSVVTTSGVHHRNQRPFDMQDRDGDPSFRTIDGSTIGEDFRITHDYYDHSDAEKDLNIILPLERLHELQQEGVIGRLAGTHYSFMGHIDGRHITTLIGYTAKQAAEKLRLDHVDVVLLTPA
jgi:D-proline reductase (dithiol) PrdB